MLGTIHNFYKMRVTLFSSFLVVLLGYGTASRCPLPPRFWCSSPDVAKACGVSRACAKVAAQTQEPAPPVNVTLYYESLCPGCQFFIKTQLYPVFKTLPNHVINVTLVPYGNAKESEDSQTGLWKFDCQHGPHECQGNLIEVCAMNIIKNISSYFPFIDCMEKSKDLPAVSGKECANQMGIKYDAIETCANGKMGNMLEHQMALRTDALDPPHKYTPWVVINGVHTETMQGEAMRDLLKLVCETYTGKKPKECITTFSTSTCRRL